MRVRALRGVCIGVDRHLKPDDITDLEAAQVQFLVSIGAVERLPDAPAAAEQTTSAITAAQADGNSEANQVLTIPNTATTKKVVGKKEK